MSDKLSGMSQLVLALLLVASPAAAQKKPSKASSELTDPCTPIGRTEDGKLVYALKCERIPVAKPQTEVTVTPPPQPPEPETVRSGLFGFSYERRPANGEASPPVARPENR